MDTTGDFCPHCKAESIVLLSTTNELKYLCETCDTRFAEEPLECVLCIKSYPIEGKKTRHISLSLHCETHGEIAKSLMTMLKPKGMIDIIENS